MSDNSCTEVNGFINYPCYVRAYFEHAHTHTPTHTHTHARTHTCTDILAYCSIFFNASACIVVMVRSVVVRLHVVNWICWREI